MTQNDHNPILVMELNELCQPIIDRMMSQGRLPNFKRLHDESDVFTTWTDDPSLEPWVQWPSFHTGKPQEVHGATQLDEGHKIKTRRIWDHLAEQGVESLVFGSMNGDTDRKDSVFLVPDPWSAGVEPSDEKYKDFHAFVSFYVAEHTNPNAKPTRAQTLKFVTFMLSHGLSLGTIMTAVRQLTSEKLSGSDMKWRRALILDLLLWDVFKQTWKTRKPKFSTFFANSSAFLQHRYWRHMSPEEYTVLPSDEEMKAYGSAIEDSYIHMDFLLGQARKLIGPSGRIVLATALSQEANTRYESIGGKFVYRAHDFAKVFEFAGGPMPQSFEPVMTHQAWATFNTETEAAEALQKITALTSNGQAILDATQDENRVFFYCNFISKVESGLPISNGTSGSANFDDLFMLVGQVNNSQHSRNGSFWTPAQNGKGQRHDEKLPLEDAYPLLMGLVEQSPKPARAAA